jgi:Uma2 family endonuclease
VVFGVKPALRDYYLLWEENVPPTVVIEVTSKSTRREDMVKKHDLYLQMGVREYYLFDPTGDYLKPERLRGFVNVGGHWKGITGPWFHSNALAST